MAFVDLEAPGGPTAVGEGAPVLAPSCVEAVTVDPNEYRVWREATARKAGVTAVCGVDKTPHLAPRVGGQGPVPPWNNGYEDLIAPGGGSF